MAARQGWAVRLGSVGETQVRVHLTMLLLLAWYAWAGWKSGGTSGAVDEIVFIVLLFASVLLHEFGHIFAARHYGIGTPDVLLTPIGGIARIARLPERPSQELVIALAGPLVTLAIALALFGVFVLGAQRSMSVDDGFMQLPLWSALLYTNVVLLVFNMIPAFPMDGGRVLRALLAARLGMVPGTRIAARVGQAVAVAFAVFGMTYSPVLLLIAAFVFLGAQAELEAVQTARLVQQTPVGRIVVSDVAVISHETTLESAARLMTTSDQRAFPVTGPSGEYVGLLTRDDVLRGISDSGVAAPVTAALHPSQPPAILLDTPFEETMQQLLQSRRDALPVIDPEGRFVGLVTRDQVADLLMADRVRRAAGNG